MENFWLAAAGAVGQAVVQEAVSRTVSSLLGKRKETASQVDYMERLEAAVRCMHSVLEKTAKAPITEVSVLRDRIELERGYMEARDVLNKHKKRQAHQEQHQQQEITQAIRTHSSSGGSPQGTSVARRTIFSIASPFIGPMMKEPSRLSSNDIERFERLAGRAQEFLGLVSRCSWLRHRIYFSGPLVFHLFQRETLTHKILEGSQEHYFRIWSIILEGRGVEAELQYTYTDHERKDKSFDLKLQLRLSQNTDIVQVAIKSLQSVAANKFVLGLILPATGALLQLASSQDIVSLAPRWCDPQCASREEKYMEITQFCRPNAVCCTAAYGYDDKPCAKESQFFPEEVISLGVRCCISGLELTLPCPSDATVATLFGDQPPQMDLLGLFVPHYMTPVMYSDLRKTAIHNILEGKESVALDIERDLVPIGLSIQQAAEKAIEGLFGMDLKEFSQTAFVLHVKDAFPRECRWSSQKWLLYSLSSSICSLAARFPKKKESLLMDYQVNWPSKHGAVFFKVHDAVRYELENGGL